MNVDDNIIDIDTNYDFGELNEAYVDESGTVLDKEDMPQVTPFDVIKKHAEMLGQEINDPKPNCNDCYGRGYIGRDSATKAPIPCRCIYNDYTNAQNTMMAQRMMGMSRSERRKMERQYKKQLRKARK